MYLDIVGKGHAIDGMSLSHNAAIACILLLVNDYRFLCNLACGKSMGWKPMGTDNAYCSFNGLAYYIFNGFCIKILLVKDVW